MTRGGRSSWAVSWRLVWCMARGFVLVTTPPVTSAGRRPPRRRSSRPHPWRWGRPRANQGPRAGAWSPSSPRPGPSRPPPPYRRNGARRIRESVGACLVGMSTDDPSGRSLRRCTSATCQQETRSCAPGLERVSVAVCGRDRQWPRTPCGPGWASRPGAPERVRDDVEV